MSDNNKKPVVKGELLSYGFAPYQDDPTQRQSYFVEIKHDNGIAKKEWGVDLERALNESNVQIGDTVILNNLGRQPINIPDPQDETKTKTVTKNLWEVEKYEPVLDLPNAIEHDTEREQEKTGVLDKTKENEQGDPSTPNHAKKVPDLSEFDFELPDNIKNNYFGIVKNRYLLDQKTNYYDKDDKNQVNIAFEDRNKSLHTSRQDEKTIYAMLDMAQAKNWTAIKLKGTDEFKQKAWLEASLRGIEVKGYEPNEKDLAELKARQAERTTNEVGMTAQKAPEPDKEQAPAEPTSMAEIESQGQETERELNTELDTGNEQTPPVDNQEQEQDMTAPTEETQAKAYQAVIVTQEFDQGTRSSWVEVIEAGTLGIGSYQEDGRAVINTPYSKENALELGVARYRIDEIESMLERGDIEPYKEVVFERSPEEQEALEQESALMQAKIAEQKAIQKEWDDRHFNNLPLEQREAILDELQGDIEKQGIGWKIAEFEGSRERYDGTLESFHQADWVREHIEAKELDKETVVEDRLDQYEKYERLASGVGEYKIDEQKYNQFIDKPQRNINQDLSYLKYETKEINQKPTPQKSAEDIKKDIRQIFQTGYKDGSIKSRDELVEVLKERGFEVKENDKSIRVSLPNSDQAVNLKGEVFTKGYDAIKSLKERLEPETLKQTYPTLTDSDIVHVTAYKNKLFDSNRDMQTPKALQASLVRLEDSVKNMAKGKDVNLPDLPVNEIKPDIEVRTTDNHDKSRQV